MNTLDNIDQQNRNGFHWGPLQTQALSTNNPLYLSSTDYGLGRLRHFLIDPNSADASYTFSLERAPSPDKVTTGQFTWYDNDGKTNANNYIGTNGMPSFIGLVLPDGTTRYTHYARNAHGNITQSVSTYSRTDGSVGVRTNAFYFSTNNIDLVLEVGPNNEQVISNYFSPGNIYHQPDASYDALNQQTSCLYNGNRQVSRITRPSGLTTTNIYYATGTYSNWLSTSIDLEISRTNSFSYANGLVYSRTDERGLTTTNFWDNLQRLTGVLFPDATSTSNQYTALDLTATKDRNGNWSRFSYNNMRQRIAETNANGAVTSYGYCSCGMLEDITNALGHVTSFNYDYQGNRTYTYFPDATLTNWFNSLRQLTVSSIGWGFETNFYNNQGLVTSVSNTFGAKQLVIYDNEDRPIYATDANGVTVTNSYDILSRLVSLGYPDGGFETFGYSARGMTAHTNQLGFATYVSYDPARRKISETNANNEGLQYFYDPSGDLTNLTDAGGHSIVCSYDAYGRLTNQLDQTGTQILSYAYDAAGRLTNRWSAAKGNTAFTRDPFGNLTNIAHPASHGVVLQYDALNRLTTMVDGVGTNTYTYTTGGQVATEGGVFSNDTLTNTYVNRRRTPLSLTQPTGSWTNGFAYDSAGRLINVASPAGAFAYILGGPSPASLQPKKISLPNSSIISNAYDAVARIAGTFLVTSTGGTLDSATYGYNVGGQRTAFTNAAGTYVQYTYDNIGQLKAGISSASSESRGYAIDPCWNLNWVTNNGTAYQFMVDTKNELTNAFGATIGYDASGNLTSQTNGQTAFVYDDENRLVQWFWYATPGTCTNGALRTDFIYDGLGRLRKRVEYNVPAPIGGGGGTSSFEHPLGPDSGGGGGGCSWVLSSETHYLYDGSRVIEERDGSNNPLAAYTRGPDLSGTAEGAGGIGGLLARSDMYSSGNFTRHNYYHCDGNGNITYLETSTQGLAASYRYDPFGNTTASSGSLAATNTYRFSSKEVHINSGMYCYSYRVYDPNLQRWSTRDPVTELGFGLMTRVPETSLGGVGIRLAENPNLFSFVLNNPSNNSDPFGLDPQRIPISTWEPCQGWDELACATECHPNAVSLCLIEKLNGLPTGQKICRCSTIKSCNGPPPFRPIPPF